VKSPGGNLDIEQGPCKTAHRKCDKDDWREGPTSRGDAQQAPRKNDQWPCEDKPDLRRNEGDKNARNYHPGHQPHDDPDALGAKLSVNVSSALIGA